MGDTPIIWDELASLNSFPYTAVRAERGKSMAWLRLKQRLKKKPKNLRGIPSTVCLNCGSRLFRVGCMFEENTISLWFTDAECALCDSKVTVPCPADDSDVNAEI